MEEILKYIDTLKTGSFTHWSESEKNAYLTACISIEEFIKKPVREKTPFENREWNYYFNEGDEVAFAFDLPENVEKSLSDPFSYLGIDNYLDIKNEIGIVVKCDTDLHSFGMGSHYWVTVKYGDEVIRALPAQYFIPVAYQQ